MSQILRIEDFNKQIDSFTSLVELNAYVQNATTGLRKVLDDISTNTSNIKLESENVQLNTDTLEELVSGASDPSDSSLPTGSLFSRLDSVVSNTSNTDTVIGQLKTLNDTKLSAVVTSVDNQLTKLTDINNSLGTSGSIYTEIDAFATQNSTDIQALTDFVAANGSSGTLFSRLDTLNTSITTLSTNNRTDLGTIEADIESLHSSLGILGSGESINTLLKTSRDNYLVDIKSDGAAVKTSVASMDTKLSTIDTSIGLNKTEVTSVKTAVDSFKNTITNSGGTTLATIDSTLTSDLLASLLATTSNTKPKLITYPLSKLTWSVINLKLLR